MSGEELLVEQARALLDMTAAAPAGEIFTRGIEACCARAFEQGDASSEFVAQRILDRIYRLHVRIPKATERTAEGSPELEAARRIIEQAFLEREERAIPREVLSNVPTGIGAFRGWLFDQIHCHAACTHPIYNGYLSDFATGEDIRFFLVQESTIDASTDDFLALLQLGAEVGVKMEIASNYWDEMGNGDPGMAHSALFARAVETFGIHLDEIEGFLQCEALACGNLQWMLGLSRRHFLKAVGYFAVAEYMAPRRFESLMRGWRRNGLDKDGAAYHEVHITVDQSHSERWMRNIVEPLAARDLASAIEIARGAMYRLNTSQRYLDRIFPSFPSRGRAEHVGTATPGALG